MLVNAKKYLLWRTNRDWYDYDENDEPYLTECATEEAKKSYEHYLKVIEEQKKRTERFI